MAVDRYFDPRSGANIPLSTALATPANYTFFDARSGRVMPLTDAIASPAGLIYFDPQSAQNYPASSVLIPAPNFTVSRLVQDGMYSAPSQGAILAIGSDVFIPHTSGTLSAATGYSANIELTKINAGYPETNIVEPHLLGGVDDHNVGCIDRTGGGRIIQWFGPHNSITNTFYRVSLSTTGDLRAGWGPLKSIAVPALNSNTYQYKIGLMADGKRYFNQRTQVNATAAANWDLVGCDDTKLDAGTDVSGDWARTPLQLANSTPRRPYPVAVRVDSSSIFVGTSDANSSEVRSSVYAYFAKLVGGVWTYYQSDGVTVLPGGAPDVTAGQGTLVVASSASANWSVRGARVNADGTKVLMLWNYPSGTAISGATDSELWIFTSPPGSLVWTGTRILANQTQFTQSGDTTGNCTLSEVDPNLLFVSEKNAGTGRWEIISYTVNWATRTISNRAVEMADPNMDFWRPVAAPLGAEASVRVIACQRVSMTAYNVFESNLVAKYVFVPPADPYEAEAVALFARQTYDYANLAPTIYFQQNANRLIKNLKAGGGAAGSGLNNYSYLSTFHCSLAGNTADARLNWAGGGAATTYDLTVTGTGPTWTQWQGHYSSAGNSWQIGAGVADPSLPNYNQNSWHSGGYLMRPAVTNDVLALCNQTTGSPTTNLINTTPGSSNLRVNCGSGITTTFTYGGNGAIIGVRSSSVLQTGYWHGSTIGTDATASTSRAGLISQFYAGAFYHMGQLLTAQQVQEINIQKHVFVRAIARATGVIL